MKKLALLTMVAVLCVSASQAGITFIATGTSAKDVEVEFKAELIIVGDILTIELFNNSLQSLNPDDLLSSFYFDIVDGGGNRPTLTYMSGIGDVWIDTPVRGMNTDDVLIESGADLVATEQQDNTWQFKDFDSALQPPTISEVIGGFGLGTVGNGAVDNSFNGNITGKIDYSIYVGEINTANLTREHLVKETAIFTFSGLTGFTEGDIVDSYAFGLGTAPDSLLVPEPATLFLLGLGSLLLRPRKIRQQQYGLSEEA